MFTYLRYFAVLSLLLVIIGAIALSTYFKEIKQSELLDTTNKLSIASLQSFTDTIWYRYEEAVRAGNPGALPQMQSDAKQFFSRQPFAKISIVSPAVNALYYGSTNAYVTHKDMSRVTLFDLPTVRNGQVVSRLLRDVYVSGGNGGGQRMMVQVILPLMDRGYNNTVAQDCKRGINQARCQPRALVEVYIDITDEWIQLRFMQYMIIGTMIGTFMLLIGMLLFTSWRAESIIARQHEVNLELTAAAASAEAQSRDKSQFLASISHELRTPLNAIIGFSDIIKTEARHQLDKVYQDYIDDIHASGRHLLSLINDILDYSKAEAGKLQIEWAETDAAKVIRNSLRMVLPRAETAQVTLVEDIPINHLVVVTDAKKLKQVLLNLLSNAVKFTPAGGAVRCQAWEDVFKQQLVIQVRDTGIGIAPKDISKVMTPFGQVDSALSRKYEGTGLGLPLSKAFVEAMGGSFLIESELNVGTTITISVPKQPKDWKGDGSMPIDQGGDDVASS
jgi:two-component system cell cycle sensor histidine kinase PleC